MAKNKELPWNADKFVSVDNTPDGDEPEALKELRVRSPRYITGLKGGVQPRVEQVNEDTWVLELGDNFMMGRPGRESIGVTKEDIEELSKVDAEPYLPEWSGITYHAKTSVPHDRKQLTRANGTRITPHYIFGDDDRQVYYPNGYPWTCVGKVESWFVVDSEKIFYGAGSGALVGKNVMLTSSHMFPWFVKNYGWQWAMKFTPAYYDGHSTRGSGVYAWCEEYFGYSDYDVGDDMVVMKLDNHLGDSLGWFGAKAYDNAWEDIPYWTKCGYPGNVASGLRPSRIMWFPIIDDDGGGAGRELEYKADSSGGDSGGPVFGWWDNGPSLVGVHAGSGEEYHFPWHMVKSNVAAGGDILPGLIRWARDNW